MTDDAGPDDAGPVVLDDPGMLRALSHPLRRRILHRLRTSGPATSTTIGAALGENTGTTSYHLRHLEKHGFIEDVPERSGGRERWWRLAEHPRDVRIPHPSSLDEANRPALLDLLRADHAEDVELLTRLPEAYARDIDWVRVSRGFAHLTRQELADFFEDYVRLLQRYDRRQEDAPAGARPIAVRLFTLPIDDPTTQGR